MPRIESDLPRVGQAESCGFWVYYQTTPQDPFDFDAVSTPVIATINVSGRPRKVVIQANRNGFLYVLDAKHGKLIAANRFGKVNWASGVDLETDARW
jgi:alcohol dehydrogenase (cytochrome c)